jgi:hypothetical protein
MDCIWRALTDNKHKIEAFSEAFGFDILLNFIYQTALYEEKVVRQIHGQILFFLDDLLAQEKKKLEVYLLSWSANPSHRWHNTAVMAQIINPRIKEISSTYSVGQINVVKMLLLLWIKEEACFWEDIVQNDEVRSIPNFVTSARVDIRVKRKQLLRKRKT